MAAIYACLLEKLYFAITFNEKRKDTLQNSKFWNELFIYLEKLPLAYEIDDV